MVPERSRWWRSRSALAGGLGLLALTLVIGASAGAQVDRDSRWEEVFRIPRPVDGRWLGPLWASGPNDVFAAGRRCIAHFDGHAWTITPDHSDSGIFAVDGSGPTDVYAVGSNETIQRWDGRQWTVEHRDRARGLRRGHLDAVHVVGPGRAHALARSEALRREPDGTWTRVSLEEAEAAVPAWRAFRDPAPASPCEGGHVRRTFMDESPTAICDGWVWTLGATGWRALELRAPRRTDVVGHLQIDAVREIVTFGDGALMFRDAGGWTREATLERGRAHSLLRVGEHVYLTQGARILRRSLTERP